MAIEWGPILLTGVTAALFNQGITWLKDSRRDKAVHRREQYNTALVLAVALERFAIDCASCVGDVRNELDELSRSGLDSYGALTTTAIPLLEIPPGIDWRWIRPDLASAALALSPQVEVSNGSIRFIGSVANPDDASEECVRQAGMRGLEAWCVAEKIRPAHGLPVAAYQFGEWKFLDELSSAAQYPLRRWLGDDACADETTWS
ncbi:hypothetical protein [Burkholderia stagnalis]|uniref:hypothetical protein n=1 Tax=Burkholderia stagnalis TaxID=1503054 RepID=UPI0012D92BBE|nr:hypothetical protein [Burkholderia stagnalis]